MEDGSLYVQINEDGTVRVSVGAGLDETYKGIFDLACREIEKPPVALESIIHLIVFGCFWIEAACNLRLQELLVFAAQPARIGPCLWSLVERKSIFEKLEMLNAFGEHGKDAEVLQNLKSTFAVRNRLAHFKETPRHLETPVDPNDLAKVIPSLPEHDLIVELRSKCSAHAGNIVAGKNWIDQIT